MANQKDPVSYSKHHPVRRRPRRQVAEYLALGKSGVRFWKKIPFDQGICSGELSQLARVFHEAPQFCA